MAVVNSGTNDVSILFNLTRWGTIPATVAQPDTMYRFFANTLDPLELTSHLGNFDSGYSASDINTATISINSTVNPVSVVVIPSHPDFDDEVLEVVFHAKEFIEGLGLLFDINVLPYTVVGEYTDSSPFTAVGKFVFVGHTSGDVNADNLGPDVSDLTFLIDYIFRGGPPPPVIEAGNVDGVSGITIADITYMVAYLFKGGPTPDCQPL